MTEFALGRHVEHDERSKTHPAPVAAKVKPVDHKRHGGVFNQGQIGSCTGNALAGALMTEPLRRDSWAFTETTALQLYEMGTKLDNVPGSYPPIDTGSTGLAVCKAAKKLGYLDSYKHAFGLEHALGALTLQPVIAGINWYESMFDPDKNGIVRIAPGTKLAGGHEILFRQMHVDKELIGFDNSWGPTWGLGGRAWISFATLEQLLAEQGDITVPIAAAKAQTPEAA